MNRIFITIILAALPMLSILADEAVKLTPSSVNIELKSGVTYYFDDDELTLEAPDTCSALTIKDGFAIIMIKDGQTLNIRGGNGILQTPAGAGIRVYPDARLYIVGAGTLNAWGGNSGAGTKGEDGGNGDAYNNKAGNGGAGGDGGGGAAAAIGGIGGKGGVGGERTSDNSQVHHGLSGGDGTAAGEIIVVGKTIVNAYPGVLSYSSITELAKYGEESHFHGSVQIGKPQHPWYQTGGGGGGGNGAPGLPALYGIGGGAPGAGGAGAGSAGCGIEYNFNNHDGGNWDFSYYEAKPIFEITDSLEYPPIDSMVTYTDVLTYNVIQWWDKGGDCVNMYGSRGQGSVDISGKRYPDTYADHTGKFIVNGIELRTAPAGLSGNRGRYGTMIGKVKVFLSPSINNYMADSTVYKEVEVLDDIPEELKLHGFIYVTFDNTEVTHDTQPKDKLISLNGEASALDVLPKNAKQESKFLGYYDDNAEQWFDENGIYCHAPDASLIGKTITLYPYWEKSYSIRVYHWHEKKNSTDASKYDEDHYILAKTTKSTAYESDLGEDSKVTIVAYPLNFEGFTPNLTTNPEVVVDVETYDERNPQCVHIYYTRNSYTLTWEIGSDAEILDEQSRYQHAYTHAGLTKYGTQIVAPKFVKKRGADGMGTFELEKWIPDAVLTDSVSDIFCMSNHDIIYHAQYKASIMPVYTKSDHGHVRIDNITAVTDAPQDSDMDGLTGEGSLFKVTANCNHTLSIIPEEGWDVSNIDVISVTHLEDGTYRRVHSTLYEQADMRGLFTLPARGEWMQLYINYLPKTAALTVSHPVSTTNTTIQVRDGNNMRDVQVLNSQEYNVTIGNKVSILVTPPTGYTISDINVKENDASGDSLIYTREICTYRDAKGVEHGGIAITYTADAQPVYVTFDIERSPRNTIVLKGRKDISMDIVSLTTGECLKDANKSAGDFAFNAFNDELLWLEYPNADCNTFRFYTFGENEERTDVANAITMTTRNIDGKEHKGFYIQVPATEVPRKYYMEGQYKALVAHYYTKTGNDPRQINWLYRDDNDITFAYDTTLVEFNIADFETTAPVRVGSDNETLHVSLAKSFSHTQWQAIALPFTFAITKELQDSFVFAQIDGIKCENRKLTSIDVTELQEGDTVSANVPYLVKSNNIGTQVMHFDTKEWQKTEPQSLVLTANEEGTDSLIVVPTYSRVYPNEFNKDGKISLIMSSGRFAHVTNPGTYILPFSFYMLYNGINSGINIGGGINPSSITNVDAYKEADDVIYDLHGRRVNGHQQLSRGIYIINNKKVLIQ